MFNAPPKIDPRRYQTKRQKLLVFAGIVLLSFIALISGLKLLGEIGAYLMGYRDMVEAGGLINSVVIITIVVVSVVGLLILVPLFRRPLDTSSQLNYIPSEVQGQPFAVRFKRKTSGLFRRSFRGTGVIQFFPDQLRVEGQREIPIIIQIIIVVTILLVAKVQLEIGIVFFTAVILMVGVISLAEYVQAIPHQAIASIRQDGNEITIESPELEPSKIVFSVNAADSQRLHGELHPRFAALLQGPR